MKSPLQLAPHPPPNYPMPIRVFLAALTHIKPVYLEAAVSCSSLLTPSATVAAAGRMDIQAADFL